LDGRSVADRASVESSAPLYPPRESDFCSLERHLQRRPTRTVSRHFFFGKNYAAERQQQYRRTDGRVVTGGAAATTTRSDSQGFVLRCVETSRSYGDRLWKQQNIPCAVVLWLHPASCSVASRSFPLAFSRIASLYDFCCCCSFFVAQKSRWDGWWAKAGSVG
jgi:hypothetical protein